MAFNLGRSRSDIAGSQDSSLNSIKPNGVALPKFTGKNANELNSLATFIEEKINTYYEYNKGITSAGIDATLERLHEALLKLKEASDTDNSNQYELLKQSIVDDVKKITLSSSDDKKISLSDEDKTFITDIIAASTLTEAKTKTEDQSGQNGLSKDDIDSALNETLKQQQVLNADVVSAAEKSNKLIENDDKVTSLKDELSQMFTDNSIKTELDDVLNKNALQFEKIQQILSTQLGNLNGRINTFGENFKNSELFGFKNPMKGSVGKILSIKDAVAKHTKNMTTTLKENSSKLYQNTIGNKISNILNFVKPKKKKKKKKRGSPGNIFAKSFAAIAPKAPEPSAAEKKEKKKKSKIFNKLNNFINGVKNFIKNIAKHLLEIFETIAIGICKIIAKGIGIILRAIFMTPWGIIILASLLLISIGILLISMAVKKLVDYVVDDLGEIIKEKLKAIDPKAIERFMDGVSNFINTFANIIGGIFYPLQLIGIAIKNIAEPVGKIIGKIASVIADVLMPIIDYIGQTLKAIIVPILESIKLLITGIMTAISKIVAVVVPVIVFIFNMIALIFENILKPIWNLMMSIIKPVLLMIGEIVKIIIAIVKPIFDFIIGLIMPILQGIKAIVDLVMALLQPLFDIITGVVVVIVEGIKIAVDVIKGVVNFVWGIIKKVWSFLTSPIKMVKKIIKGIGNWLASFADFEIGFWKFKFKPLGFLKGLKSDDSGDDEEIDGGNEELQKKIKELTADNKFLVKYCEELKAKLKAAMQITIPRILIIKMIRGVGLIATALSKKILPMLQDMFDILKQIAKNYGIEVAEKKKEEKKKPMSYLDKLKARFAAKYKKNNNFSKNKEVKKKKPLTMIDMVKSIYKGIQLILKKLGISTEKKKKPVEKAKKPMSFLDKMKARFSSKFKKAKKTGIGLFNRFKKSSIFKKAKKTGIGLFNRFKKSSIFKKAKKTGIGLFNRFKKSSIYDRFKNNELFSKYFKDNQPKLQITQKSISSQFKPINNINDSNKKHINEVSEKMSDIKETEVKEKNTDITNNDLRRFLQSMFEKVDINFQNINEKLDNPQLLPIPTSMNVNNQALLGAQ